MRFDTNRLCNTLFICLLICSDYEQIIYFIHSAVGWRPPGLLHFWSPRMYIHSQSTQSQETWESQGSWNHCWEQCPLPSGERPSQKQVEKPREELMQSQEVTEAREKTLLCEPRLGANMYLFSCSMSAQSRERGIAGSRGPG